MDWGMVRNLSVEPWGATELRVDGLRPDVAYRFTVQAYSESGASPVSDPFLGTTLKEGMCNMVLSLPVGLVIIRLSF